MHTEKQEQRAKSQPILINADPLDQLKSMFVTATRILLSETHDIQEALQLFWGVTRDLGLTAADAPPEPRPDEDEDEPEQEEPVVPVEEGEEGDEPPQSAASGPSLTQRKATKQAKQAIYRKAFEHRMGSGRKIGDFRWSELSNHEVLSRRDASIFRMVREHAQPSRDQKVGDYFPGKKLQEILETVKKNANH